MITRNENPCKPDCPDRHAGCHGTCREYRVFREEREKVYESRSKYYEAADYAMASIEKNRRKK